MHTHESSHKPSLSCFLKPLIEIDVNQKIRWKNKEKSIQIVF